MSEWCFLTHNLQLWIPQPNYCRAAMHFSNFPFHLLSDYRKRTTDMILYSNWIILGISPWRSIKILVHNAVITTAVYFVLCRVPIPVDTYFHIVLSAQSWFLCRCFLYLQEPPGIPIYQRPFGEVLTQMINC